MTDVADDLQLIVTLTDEEVGVLIDQCGVDLPLPSIDAPDRSRPDAAAHTARRSLMARGLCDGTGAPIDDVRELVSSLRDQVIRGERMVADRIDHLRVARSPEGFVADLITGDGFHQFVAGTPDGLADILAGWVVPIECAFRGGVELQLTRQQLAAQPELLARLGEIEVVTTMTANHVAAQEFSVYAGVDRAVRAVSTGDGVDFTSIDETELRTLLSSLLGQAVS